MAETDNGDFIPLVNGTETGPHPIGNSKLNAFIKWFFALPDEDRKARYEKADAVAFEEESTYYDWLEALGYKPEANYEIARWSDDGGSARFPDFGPGINIGFTNPGFDPITD